mgnify:CR=1 FL=1
MTTTTHISSACIITVLVIKSGIGTFEAFLAAACASCVAHLILDIIPHGFIAAPDTIFKKLLPTLLELGPGLIILVYAVYVFGNPLLFLWATGFGILPDIVSTLIWKRQELFSAIPGFALIHRAHRIVHWFEKDNHDGTVSYMFPSPPLLAAETVLVISLVFILFMGFTA